MSSPFRVGRHIVFTNLFIFCEFSFFFVFFFQPKPLLKRTGCSQQEQILFRVDPYFRRAAKTNFERVPFLERPYQFPYNKSSFMFQRQRVDSVLQKYCQAILPSDSQLKFQSLLPPLQQVIICPFIPDVFSRLSLFHHASMSCPLSIALNKKLFSLEKV